MKDFSSIKLKSEGITDERILNTLLKYEKKDFFTSEKNSFINSDSDFIDENNFIVLRSIVCSGALYNFLMLAMSVDLSSPCSLSHTSLGNGHNSLNRFT